MKKIILQITALALGLGFTQAAETDADRVESSTSVPRPARDTAVRSVPIRDYWDANSWDPVAGPIFWRDRSEKRRAAMSEPKAKRPAPANSAGDKAGTR